MSVTDSIQTILIIGATSGIGEAFARRLHAQGKQVIATGRREANLAALSADCPGIATHTFDISDLSSIPTHVETLLKQHPTINAVWANSGIQQSFSFADTQNVPSDQDLANEVTVNITAPILLAKHFAPHLQQLGKERETFCIITSSGIAYVPTAAYPVYSATKAATHHLAVCLRAQLGGAGVRVVEIAPPYVATELDRNHREAAAGLEPMPLAEYTDKTLEVLGSTKPGEVKEVGVGFAEMGVKAWRGAFQPILEHVGMGSA